MEVNGSEGIQYVTTDGGEQQIYIQGGEGAVAGQSLLQGAQIIDGKLVLPQQYQYVTENGETVMLVYETPDGQQVMAENGEQIVFLDESQAAQQAEGAELEGEVAEQQTTYIQQVGADGQTFLQQVTTTGDDGEPQTAFVQQQMEDTEGQEQATYVQVAGGDDQTVQQTFIQQMATPAEEEAAPQQTTFVQQESGIPEVQPGQSLLLPQVTGRQVHQQIRVSEGGQTSTVVMVSSDGSGQTSNLATFMEGEVEQGQAVAPVTQDEDGLIQQAGQVLQQQRQYEEGDGLQMNLQSDDQGTIIHQSEQNETKIVIKMLNPEEEESSEYESAPAPIAVMNMRSGAQDQPLPQTAFTAEQLIAEPEDLDQPEPEAFNISEEPDEEGRITMIDPSTGELVKVMPEVEQEVPVLFTPEELLDKPDNTFEDEFEPEVRLTLNKNTSEVRVNKPTKTATPKPATPASKVAVTPSTQESAKSATQMPFDDDDDLDEEEDSDFDEENLTPKVVYERLLAQHRKTKECQVCGDTLESYPKLKEHLMEHAGYNPCECQICGKILSTSAQRAKHEKSHTKPQTPKPVAGEPQENATSPKKTPTEENKEKYECDICGRQVGRPEHLKRHKKIHEPGPTWRCIICEYSFKREDLVKDHVKKQHKDALEQEALKDLYEKLQYESTDSIQNKSQWNPNKKTPKNNKEKTPKEKKPPKTPKVAKPATPKPEDASKPEDAAQTEDASKSKEVSKSTPKVVKPKVEKVMGTPVTGVRKSGRTPKPKRLNDIATEEEIVKAENEEFDEEEEEKPKSKSPSKAKMKVKLDLKKKKPEEKKVKEEEEEEEMEVEEGRLVGEIFEGDEIMEEEDEEYVEELMEDEMFDGDEPVAIRRTVGKSVVVTFIGVSEESKPKGTKRKASKMDDDTEEVIILDVKGPKQGKMWKPFRKSQTSSPASTPASKKSSTPRSRSGTPSSRSATPTHKSISTKTPIVRVKKLEVKSEPVSTVAKYTPRSTTSRRQQTPVSSNKKVTITTVKSMRYEDDEFVYFDDDDDEIEESEYEQTPNDSATTDDEIIVIRAPEKKARKSSPSKSPSPSKRGRKPGPRNTPKPRKTVTKTPVRRGGSKTPVIKLTRSNKRQKRA